MEDAYIVIHDKTEHFCDSLNEAMSYYLYFKLLSHNVLLIDNCNNIGNIVEEYHV